MIRYFAQLSVSPSKVSFAGKLCLLAIAIGLLLGKSEVEAQPAPRDQATEVHPRYTISHWQGPKQCRDQSHFRALLEGALGPATGAPASTPMQVSVQIERRAGTFHLTLTTEDQAGHGSRELSAPQCEELLATAAIIVSLAMQPDLLYQNESEHQVITAPFAQSQASDEERPRYPGPRTEDIVIKSSSVSSSRPRIAIGLAAIGDLGTLPRPAVGFAVVASARSQDYRLAFRLTQWAEQRRFVSSFRPERGGHFDYISGSLDLCRDVFPGPVSVGGCAVGGLGRLNGQSIVIDLPIDQAHIMATAGGGLFWELPTGGGSSLRVQGELVAQLVRPDYNAEVLDKEDDRIVIKMHIHTVAPVVARLATSWELSF